jgi:8-oxo-dGTP pyrophosphatase MutT (NUDIX family)
MARLASYIGNPTVARADSLRVTVAAVPMRWFQVRLLADRQGIVARIDHYRSPGAPAANSIVVAVTAFVRDHAGRVLLIRRTDNDLYAIPGGAVELGETLTAAVRREVMEETGIAVVVTGLVGVYSDPEHVIEFSDGEVRQEFSVCFRAEPVGGELRTSGESKEVLWVAPGDLERRNIHTSIRLRVRHGLEARVEPYYL